MVDKPEPKPITKDVKLAWSRGDHLDPVVVDQMQLQVMNHNLYLTFGQIRPVEEPTAELVAEVRPVSRVFMTLDVAKKVAAVLNKHIQEEAK